MLTISSVPGFRRIAHSQGVSADLAADSDAGVIMWTCHDKDSAAIHGPFTVPYHGTPAGPNAMSVFLNGAGSQLDHVYVQNPRRYDAPFVCHDMTLGVWPGF